MEKQVGAMETYSVPFHERLRFSIESDPRVNLGMPYLSYCENGVDIVCTTTIILWF